MKKLISIYERRLDGIEKAQVITRITAQISKTKNEGAQFKMSTKAQISKTKNEGANLNIRAQIRRQRESSVINKYTSYIKINEKRISMYDRRLNIIQRAQLITGTVRISK